MKIRVSEASGLVLDWMVERALGTHWSANGYFVFRYEGCGPNGFISSEPQWSYSTDWSQGGPIIDQEEVMFHAGPDRNTVMAYLRRTGYALAGCSWAGPTHLVAAMRCFVASKLGDEVDVPEELL